jgi:hypothetical protein
MSGIPSQLPRTVVTAADVVTTTQHIVEELTNLEPQAKSKEAIFSLPSQLKEMEQQATLLGNNELYPLSSDQNALRQLNIEKIKTVMTRIQTELTKTQTNEANGLDNEVDLFSRSDLRTMTRASIREKFEGFEKRITELEEGGPNQVLEKIKKQITANKGWLTECGKADTGSSSSSSSPLSSSSNSSSSSRSSSASTHVRAQGVGGRTRQIPSHSSSASSSTFSGSSLSSTSTHVRAQGLGGRAGQIPTHSSLASSSSTTTSPISPPRPSQPPEILIPSTFSTFSSSSLSDLSDPFRLYAPPNEEDTFYHSTSFSHMSSSSRSSPTLSRTPNHRSKNDADKLFDTVSEFLKSPGTQLLLPNQIEEQIERYRKHLTELEDKSTPGTWKIHELFACRDTMQRGLPVDPPSNLFPISSSGSSSSSSSSSSSGTTQPQQSEWDAIDELDLTTTSSAFSFPSSSSSSWDSISSIVVSDPQAPVQDNIYSNPNSDLEEAIRQSLASLNSSSSASSSSSSSSSTLSSSRNSVLSEHSHTVGKPTTIVLARRLACLHFLDKGITSAAYQDVDGMIEMGQKLVEQGEFYIPDNLKRTAFAEGDSQFYHWKSHSIVRMLNLALNDLDEVRKKDHFNVIGALFHYGDNYHAVTLREVNKKYSIYLFNPAGNSKAMQRMKHAFASIEEASTFLAQMYPSKDGQFEMQMFISKRAAAYQPRSSSLSRSASTRAPSASSTSAPSRPRNVVQPLYLKLANELNAIKQAVQNQSALLITSSERLQNLKTEINLFIGDQNVAMPIGGLVFYHLTMLHAAVPIPSPRLSDPLFGIKAFENFYGFSTDDDRICALLRAETDVLLAGFIDAVTTGEFTHAGQFCKKIREIAKELKKYEDSIPELENFGRTEKPLDEAIDVCKKLKKQWDLP